jgi:signal transduction protein with GAF and PtsI domain
MTHLWSGLVVQSGYRISSATTISLKPSIQFAMERESDSVIAFLGVPVIREKTTLVTKVNRKHTHTGRYLNFDYNHPPHVKKV